MTNYIDLFQDAVFDTSAATPVGNPVYGATITSQTVGTPPVMVDPGIVSQISQPFTDNSFTFAGWVQYTSEEAEYIFSIDEGNNDHYLTFYATKNRMEFQYRRPYLPGEVSDNTGENLNQQVRVIFNSPNNIPDGQSLKPSGHKIADGLWHFIAIVCRGRNIVYYIDGERFDPWSIIYRQPQLGKIQSYSTQSQPILTLPYDIYLPSSGLHGAIGGETNDPKHNLADGSVSKLFLVRRALDESTLLCIASCNEFLLVDVPTTLTSYYNPATKVLNFYSNLNLSVEVYTAFLRNIRYESALLEANDNRVVSIKVSCLLYLLTDNFKMPLKRVYLLVNAQ